MKRFQNVWLIFLVALHVLTFAYSGSRADDSAAFDPTTVTVAAVPASSVPVGTVVPWPNATPPAGWLECNGSVFNTSTYSALHVILGANRVPDLRGVFVRGWDHGRGIDSGRALKSSQGDSVGPHSVSVSIQTTSHMGHSGNDGSLPASAFGIVRTYSNLVGTSNVTGSVSGTETRPRNVAMMYIIKAQ